MEEDRYGVMDAIRRRIMESEQRRMDWQAAQAIKAAMIWGVPQPLVTHWARPRRVPHWRRVHRWLESRRVPS